MVALLQPGHTLTTFGDAKILEHRAAGSGPRDIYEHDDPTAWFTALNVHPTDGWFALAATVAPQGGPTYDDLAVLDPTDDTAFLVVFAQQRGDTLWLARRLFHERDPAATRIPSP